jgi:curved DNA-binding protein CbpA
MDGKRVEAFGVLGIPADSDQNAVARAYRRLARATHPDVSNDPDAADRFATVAAAFQLVSQDPRPTSIPVRIHEPAPGDQGRAYAVRLEPGVTLGGRRDQRAPIVAGPAWVDPPRRLDATEVRGG